MVSYLRSDLEFILQQILYAERQAAGDSLTDILPNAHVSFGLRTVDGSLNNLVFGQGEFGAADNLFPRLTDPVFRDAEGNTTYTQTSGTVIDSQPRTISNLIVDQTITNPAAVEAFVQAGLGTRQLDVNGDPVFNPDGTPVILDADGNVIPRGQTLTIPNTTPDEGLSAGFNSWFTFFGQFFDHGLDLVTKGGSGTVFIPLQPDDPLYVEGSPTNFMVLTRATNQPGLDGVLGDDPATADIDESLDDVHEHTNTTSPFVDQNQTYSSHASHQVFLRAYELNAAGDPVATGKLLENVDLGADGRFGGTDFNADTHIGGMATWGVLKAQARDMLGIQLTDADIGNVPLLATDLYGNFIRGDNGFPKVAVDLGDGTIVFVEGNPLAPIDLSNPIPGDPDAFVVRTGHAFLDDIAATANPFNNVGGPRTADLNNTADDHFTALGDDGLPMANNRASAPGQGSANYDNELLDAHYVAGDGRVNENIGLTTVHSVFHAEHNRLVDHSKDVAVATGDANFVKSWMVGGDDFAAEDIATLQSDLDLINLMPTGTPEQQNAKRTAIDALDWNGERLFQAAKFGTEMQYQHLVFEEFGRKVSPNIDEFLAPEGYDATINAAITAEFAHTVYRFGHSMLTETVDRLDPNFDGSEMGLIDAFLNPLAFADTAATPEAITGAIVRGVTRQAGNEIDEFVTDVLRNNLLGRPLDLATLNLARGRDTGMPSLNDARTTFFAATNDTQLKPYTSWVNFMTHLKHPESLINFIAAYGTHASITGATTMEDKRAAATLLVLGDGDDSDGVIINGTLYTNRHDFLNATGEFTGGSLGGLNNVDFWIGGLAEAQQPFGGLLGSSFNFVFESQLEALQNGDRFYYLARTAGLNFLNELEANSFAKLIMKNSDATHLPADVFTTPAFTLEVNRAIQHTGLDDPLDIDGIAGNSDPTGGLTINGLEVRALVERDDPGTAGPDANYLRYNGEDHVVLGGTASDDTIISSIGDDTLWGDGGDDRLEGGDGVDVIEGGDGDDIITDLGGDDNLQGGAGNDVISGGNGFNLILGGAGNDFIITGEDVSDTFGGTGNDFILGSPLNLPTLGNEGDDWIEIGTQDGAGGDNFDPQEAGTITGHDVFITGSLFDEVDGEGGDDIMVGSDGPDHFGGGGGYDWASYENDTRGTTIDLNVNDFVEPPVAGSAAGILDRFAQVEGLSGTNFNDVLRGDDLDAAGITAGGGAQDSTLTQDGIARIEGLQALLNTAFGQTITSFNGGNIILGGSGSDVIEGRGGDDVIDGDSRMNVRISVRAAVDGNGNPTGGQIATFESMTDPTLLQNMLDGTWNPGQLQISREILSSSDGYDTAVFSENLQSLQTFRDANGDDVLLTVDNYAISTVAGVTTVRHLVYDRDLDANGDPVVTAAATGADGEDRLINVERLQFGDQAVVVDPTGNAGPVGELTISSPSAGVLVASAAGVTDADNVSSSGALTGPVAFVWQQETLPGSNVFTDIIAVDGSRFTREQAQTLQITADLDGLQVRVRAIYEDENGTLENVYSDATTAVFVAPAPVAPIPEESPTVSAGVRLIRSDLQFILDQIKIAERHTDGENLADILPNSRLPFGLRTVDGSFNNVVPGQEHFGAADQNFPLLTGQDFRNEGDDSFTFDPDGPGGPQPAVTVNNNNYATTGPVNGNVVDADPRLISNLISDQTITNPAAVEAFLQAGLGTRQLDVNGDPVFNPDGTPVILDAAGIVIPHGQTLSIPNTAPDEGLSAGFNSWMTLFGQFFDHGLDLVNKGGNGVIFVPLAADDPLVLSGQVTVGVNDFMVVTRATNTAILAGDDGQFNTADDVHFHNNQTTPFVDQNQTYTSHASHQFFLREYVLDTDGRPVATGRLLDGPDGGLPTWGQIKEQARTILGIELDDRDVLNVPMVRTDLYGNFLPDTATGMPQIVTLGGLVTASLATPIDATDAIRTNHAFLDDIAHAANPRSSQGQLLTADTDSGLGLANSDNSSTAGFYDNELLDRHFITGDGRGNENIGLTAVHHVFHAEHNRLTDHIQDVVLASNDANFVNEWLRAGPANQVTQAQVNVINAMPVGTPAEQLAREQAIDALAWNGERLFQAARFGTEMQYQHLVFEEFARKVQPQVDVFLGEGQGYDTTINPAIFAEFAHTVYRFGHTMLTETIDRLDPNFQSSEIGLVEAFLNPLAFNGDGTGTVTMTADEAAGAIIRGMTRQAGQEIDEFVTEALRNNLLGLPLDLPTINITRGRDTGVPSLNDARAQFFAMTGDSQLKPYTSWSDLMVNLKNPMSVINFIAAYGTHASITSATTLVDKRAAATLLVLGDFDLDGDGTPETAPADRVDFMNALGEYAPDGDGPKDDTRGGLNTVDFWIGGLAERQMPFGGLLGSSFNFVFETQMENLQFADRFYYLERTAGLNFLTELENNSFAKLIMANTNTTHLPGDVFSTPAFTLEVDQSRQHTGLNDAGADGVFDDNPDTAVNESLDNHIGNADPTGGIGINGQEISALVIRDNPDTPGEDTNYLRYTGGDHVVLGGTENNDIIISGIGDDTLWGDGGDDRLEGGDGVDMILGGAGDDIITDLGGEDNLQGGEGNDALQAGNGIDLVLGGFGNDFIVTGADSDESFGGVGNDFILGDRADEAQFGNEGDDWIEHGAADGAAGDSFDVRGLDEIRGHDVFMGDTVADRMFGEGGDDILVGNGGFGDRYLGASGFDWASYQGDRAATADLRLRAFDATPVPISPVTVLPRFESIEGISGSSKADILTGDDLTEGQIATSGAYGSVLDEAGIDRITGMQELLDTALGVTAGTTTSFGAGNIILGGGGGDILQGNGGDDIIDGDRHLHVRIHVDTDNDNIEDVGEISITSLEDIADDVFAGLINPGNLRIVREILAGPAGFDTASFSGARSEYEIFVNDTLVPVGDAFNVDANDVVRVEHRLLDDTGAIIPGSSGADGADRLINVERLQFSDQKVILTPNINNEPVGNLTITYASPGGPNVGEILTVSAAAVTDVDNVGGAITPPISFIWQVETVPGSGVFEDIVLAVALGDQRALGPTLALTPDLDGLRVRAMAIYEDAGGTLEQVFSEPTLPVGADTDANDPPVNTVPATFETTEDTPVALAGISVADIDAGTGQITVTFSVPAGSGTITATGAGGVVVSNSGSDTLTLEGTLSSINAFLAGPNVPLFTPVKDLNGTVALTVTTSDLGNTGVGGPQVAVNEIDINIAPVNDTPTAIVLDTPTVAETENDGGLVGTLAANDPDGDALTFTLVNDAGGRFALDGDQIVVANGVALDFEQAASHTIRVSVTDGIGPAFEQNITIAVTNVDPERVDGTAAADTIFGGAGADRLSGNASNDVIFGQGGNDRLDGGAGTDTAVFRGEVTAATFTTGGGGSLNVTTALDGTDRVSNFETLRFGADASGTGGTNYNLVVGTNGAETLTGSNVADLILGFRRNDTINAGNGNDVIVQNAGDDRDTVNGGGNAAAGDRFILNGTAAAETFKIMTAAQALARIPGLALAAGTEIVVTRQAGNVGANNNAGLQVLAELRDIEEITVNGSGITIPQPPGTVAGDNVQLIGNFNTTSLNFNTVTVLGSSGNDTVDISQLTSGHRIDFASGGGHDTLVGNQRPNDVIDTTDAASFTRSGSGSDDLIRGTSGDDIIKGRAGNDKLADGDGEDRVFGGSGTDSFRASLGNDKLYGQGGRDTYTASHATGSVTVNLSAGFARGADVGRDKLFGIENAVTGSGNDVLIGDKHANVLIGNAGNDTIKGQGGDDKLIGGAGADELSGGTGNDRYDFNSLSELGNSAATRDRILDFTGAGIRSGDSIDLRELDAIVGGGDDSFVFVGVGPLTALGQLHYRVTADGSTIIEGNIAGGTGAEFQIEIAGVHILSASDFLL